MSYSGVHRAKATSPGRRQVQRVAAGCIDHNGPGNEGAQRGRTATFGISGRSAGDLHRSGDDYRTTGYGRIYSTKENGDPPKAAV